MTTCSKPSLETVLALGDDGLQIVSDMQNQALLKDVAMNSTSKAVASAAIAKIDSEFHLSHIACHGRSSTARIQAFSRITSTNKLLLCVSNESFLKLAATDQGFWGGLAAKLDSQTLTFLLSSRKCPDQLLAAGMDFLVEHGLIRQTVEELEPDCSRKFADALNAITAVLDHPTWGEFHDQADKIPSVQTLITVWKKVDDWDRDSGWMKEKVLAGLRDNHAFLIALWNEPSPEGWEPANWVRTRILGFLEGDGEALETLAQNTPDDSPWKAKITCARIGHDVESWEEEEAYTYFPEGIEPCTENLCFMECETYTVQKKRCKRCGRTLDAS